MESNKDKNIFTHFMKYQAVYALVAYLIITWTIYGADISNLKSNDLKQDVKIEQNNLTGQEIKTRLASIETSLEFIKQQISN